MRILLDECVSRRLKHYITGHSVSTVGEQGWSGIRNGELLELAARLFDVLVTVDRGIEHQQDLQMLPVAVILLKARSNRVEHLRPLVLKLSGILREMKHGEFRIVGE